MTQPSVGSAPALATPADSRRVSFVESKDDEDIPGSPRSYLLQRGVDTKVLKPFKLTIEVSLGMGRGDAHHRLAFRAWPTAEGGVEVSCVLTSTAS